MRFFSVVVLIAVANVLQAQQTAPSPPEPPGTHDKSYYDPKGRGVLKDQQQVVVQEGELELSAKDSYLSGKFKSAVGTVVFRENKLVNAKTINVQVETNNLVLNADIDFEKQTAILKGSVTKERVLQMTLVDRSLVLSTLRAVERRITPTKERLNLPSETLLRSLEVW